MTYGDVAVHREQDNQPWRHQVDHVTQEFRDFARDPIVALHKTSSGHLVVQLVDGQNESYKQGKSVKDSQSSKVICVGFLVVDWRKEDDEREAISKESN